jgi:putative transposase
MAEHMHRFVSVRATDVPTHLVWAFKGRTARVLRQKSPHLRNHATVLWSPSYLTVSVGDLWGSTVRRYVEHRWDVVAS